MYCSFTLYILFASLRATCFTVPPDRQNQKECISICDINTRTVRQKKRRELKRRGKCEKQKAWIVRGNLSKMHLIKLNKSSAFGKISIRNK